MSIAIVYHSTGGNTRALATMLKHLLPTADLYEVREFSMKQLDDYETVLIGTNTWGNGDLPRRMRPFAEEFAHTDLSHLRVGVFGTGETSYRYFCNAVNILGNAAMHTAKEVLGLKIEQMYQQADMDRIEQFAEWAKQPSLSVM